MAAVTITRFTARVQVSTQDLCVVSHLLFWFISIKIRNIAIVTTLSGSSSTWFIYWLILILREFRGLDCHLLSCRLKTPNKPMAQRPQTDRHEQARNFYLLQQSLQSRRITFIFAKMWFYTFTKSDSEKKTTPSGNNGICIQYKFAKHIKISFYNLFCSNQFSLLVCHSANCVVSKTEPKHDLNIPASWRSVSSVLNILDSNICTLHSLCLQFKSFCPVVRIYGLEGIQVCLAGDKCLTGRWRVGEWIVQQPACWGLKRSVDAGSTLGFGEDDCFREPGKCCQKSKKLLELFFFFFLHRNNNKRHDRSGWVV